MRKWPGTTDVIRGVGFGFFFTYRIISDRRETLQERCRFVHAVELVQLEIPDISRDFSQPLDY